MHSYIKLIVLCLATCITIQGAAKKQGACKLKRLRKQHALAAQSKLAAAVNATLPHCPSVGAAAAAQGPALPPTQQLTLAPDKAAAAAAQACAELPTQLAQLSERVLNNSLANKEYEYLKDPARKAQLIAAATDKKSEHDKQVAKQRADIIHKLVPDNSNNPLYILKKLNGIELNNNKLVYYRIICAIDASKNKAELITFIKSIHPDELYLLSQEYPDYVHLSYSPY